MEKSIITIIGKRDAHAHAGCGHDHENGHAHGHDHGNCGHEANGCGCESNSGCGESNGCASSCGCSHPMSDIEQFENLAQFIHQCDMQDEVQLQFMDWTDEMSVKYPKIAQLLSDGYELPFVAIDDSIRYAGAVHPDKIVHMVNEMRQKQHEETMA